jgi:hypothetical protein
MALALVVLLEKDLPESMAVYTKTGTGKALIREADRVNFAARKCNVPALTSMLSESQAALIEQLMADGFDPKKMRLPPEVWYTAAEGLAVIRPLIEHVGKNLNDFKRPNPILRDLRAAEALLTTAESAGVRFHFVKAEL